MFKSILAKTLYEKRWMMLAWGLGMIITAAITMALYPSFSQLGADEFVNSVPDSLKSLIGSVESFKSIPGYVAQQIYGPQIPIMTIVLAVVLYIGIGVGEEDRGILQTLMAQPITRTSLYLQKFYAGAVVLTIVSVTVAIGVLGGVVALGESISIVRLLQATIMLSPTQCCIRCGGLCNWHGNRQKSTRHWRLQRLRIPKFLHLLTSTFRQSTAAIRKTVSLLLLQCTATCCSRLRLVKRSGDFRIHCRAIGSRLAWFLTTRY
jgi:hypothetical protein